MPNNGISSCGKTAYTTGRKWTVHNMFSHIFIIIFETAEINKKTAHYTVIALWSGKFRQELFACVSKAVLKYASIQGCCNTHDALGTVHSYKTAVLLRINLLGFCDFKTWGSILRDATVKYRDHLYKGRGLLTWHVVMAVSFKTQSLLNDIADVLLGIQLSYLMWNTALKPWWIS